MDKKVKVSFFAPEASPYFQENNKGVYGGAELQMYLLSRNLSQNKNFKTSFFLSEVKVKSNVNENLKLVKSFSMPKEDLLLNKFIKSIKLFFLLRNNKPDILVTTCANSIIGIVAFYKKILGFKHVHRTASTIDVDKSWIKENGLLGKIYNYGLKKADKIIVQNKEQQELLMIKHSLESSILKNAIRLKELSNTVKSDILWVGRFDTLKRPELFIELANVFPNENFIMICPYNKNHFNSWEKMKETIKHFKNFELIEKVEYTEISKFFDKAKCFVNTSSVEGFPNTFLQAALSQTPIVSLNVNPDNFLTNYNCGVYCRDKFENLVDTIRNLLSSSKNRITMGKNAYTYLKDNHDIEKISNQFSKIIESIL